MHYLEIVGDHTDADIHPDGEVLGCLDHKTYSDHAFNLYLVVNTFEDDRGNSTGSLTAFGCTEFNILRSYHDVDRLVGFESFIDAFELPAAHFNKTVGIGGSFGFNRMSLNLEDRTGSVTAAAANMFSLMADAKFNWFRGDVFGMYSKLGLGVMCLNGSMMEESGGNIWLPTGQLSLIGMELGRQFCGFLEIGPGMQGIAQIGFKYHF